jgi:AcrR family transcriptional regulator
MLDLPVADPSRPRSEARERLLRRASEIFYANGIKGVGVDRIVRESEVTRATFYRHFAGKEELVVAYLQAVDAATRARFSELQRKHPDPAYLLRAVAGAIGDMIATEGFRGCAFINAAAEYPDPRSPVRRAIAEHRDWLFAFLRDAFAQAGHPEADSAARSMIMLRDGAVVAGYLATAAEARRTLLDGVDALLAAGRPARRRRRS